MTTEATVTNEGFSRRTGKHNRGPDNTSTLTYKSLILDRKTREVYRGYKKIDLTAAEFDLLMLFMHYPEKVLSKETIAQQVSGYLNNINLVDNSVGPLRIKLGEPSLIQTVKNIGYVLQRVHA